MKSAFILFFLTLNVYCFGHAEPFCKATYKGSTETKLYDEIEMELSLEYEDQQLVILETTLLDRYFAATYDKVSESLFLQIVSIPDTTVGQTSKSFLPRGKSSTIFEIKGGHVFSLTCVNN